MTDEPDDALALTMAATDARPGAGPVERVTLSEILVEPEVRYHRERVLGEGGMGIVELHRDARIGRGIAMKILREDLDDDTSRRRFLREAQLQGQLEHPSIVPVYDVGPRPDGSLFFTMKQVRGVTLHEVIRGLRQADPRFEKYTRHRLLTAFAQVCLAVDFAHSRGVLHRDLKPANIMLGDFGEVYVLDWGIAKLGDGDAPVAGERPLQPADAPPTEDGALVGTLGYMPPEQLHGEPIAETADVYALGAILFEVLALEPYHERGKPEQVIAATLAGGEPRPSRRAPIEEVAPELDEICAKALALAPGDRFARARELHTAIERYLEGERDQQLRLARAAEHLQAAQRAYDEAITAKGEVAIAARRRAMQELGWVNHYNPRQPGLHDALKKVVNGPLETLPFEVVAAIEHGERVRFRKLALVGIGTYLATWLFLPLLLASGISKPAPMIGFFAGMTAAAALSGLVRWLDRPSLVVLPLIASSVGFGFVSGLFGPLLLVPTIALVNTVAYTIHTPRRIRPLLFLLGVGAFLVPLALELAGVIPASYEFGGQGMLVVGSQLTEGWTIGVLVVAQVFATVLGVFIIGILRDYVDKAELAAYQYAWHLREWIPDENLRREIDPVNRRRTR